MKICVAQTRPVKGDVAANIAQHINLILEAVAQGAALIIFPELSLTAYEPRLAAALATTADDPRFEVFQALSDKHNISIGVGMPLREPGGVTIGMPIFQPFKPVLVYAKKYLHPDELPFFRSGQNFNPLQIANTSIVLAICYELSVPAHAQEAFGAGAHVYIASVAKSAKGMASAQERLSQIATDYAVPVLLCNSIGEQDGMECCGRSAVWNREGQLLDQLDQMQEGLLFFEVAAAQTLEQER